jgi:2-phospho-L-lactate guanylyltransferase
LRIWALVPVKEWPLAKRRLGPSVDPALRRRLFMAMVEDVFAALARSHALSGFATVTVDSAVQAAARQHGGLVVERHAQRGHNAAVRSGVAFLVERGAEGVLTLPMDVPLTEPTDVDGLIEVHLGAHVHLTIVPAHDLRGTNAMLTTPPGCIEPAFGQMSARRHMSAARAAGARAQIVHNPHLGLDIDRAADLGRLLKIGGVTHTHRLLARVGQPGPYSNPLRSQAMLWE